MEKAGHLNRLRIAKHPVAEAAVARAREAPLNFKLITLFVLTDRIGFPSQILMANDLIQPINPRLMNLEITGKLFDHGLRVHPLVRMRATLWRYELTSKVFQQGKICLSRRKDGLRAQLLSRSLNN